MNVDSKLDEWEVVAFADQHSDRELLQVFERGFTGYEDSDEGRQNYLEDLDLTAEWMFDKRKYGSLFEEPKLPRAAGVAVLCSTAACAFRKHDYYQDAPFEKMQLVTNNARRLHTALLMPLLDEFEPESLLRIFGRLYDKNIDRNHPYPGKIVRAIVYHEHAHPEFNQFIEIPLACASEICMARFHDGKWESQYDPEANDAVGTTNYHIRDNCIYVPFEHAKMLLLDQQKEAFERLVEFAWEHTDDTEIETVFNECEHIKGGIDDILNHGEEERLWTDWDPQKNLLRLVRNAVKEAPEIDPTEWNTAETYYEAIQNYDADGFGESRAKDNVLSVMSLAKKLGKIASSSDFSTVDIQRRQGSPSVYTVGTPNHGAKEIAVDSLDDIFKLPCFQNMEEALKLENSGPVRKDLYNFVRMVYWLKGYHEMPEGDREDAVVEDMHHLFEKKWDWYDPAKTEYQSRYELREGEINGNTPLPMHCDNDDMQRHCIGKNLCPYSIYGSLPFPDEMYELIEEN